MCNSSYALPVLFLILGTLEVGCSDGEGGVGAAAAGGTRATGGSIGMSGVGGSSAIASVGGFSMSGGTEARGGATSAGGAVTTGGPRVACAAPSRYRNLFVEILGKTQADVDTKLTAAVNQLFHGTEPIYYEMGTNQAYIKDIANNDVRSEGQSYGMLIAVQMGLKTEFDKLWNYAASCMRQSSNLFAWQMNAGACSAKSTGIAPDGDEYFAMALMLASKRWGNSTGIDYASEAKKGLKAMADTNNQVFHASPAVVTFGPYQNFSDPSYVLPLFSSEWACFDTANTSFWNSVTTYGRTFFQKTTNATTGLAPYQANWDGSPYNSSSFNADSWRVPMNIMMDYNLNNADPWQATWAQRMAAFWVKEGLNSYGSGYSLDGTKTTSGHGAGLTAANAMLAFAIPAADGKPFLQAAWDTPTPTGTYRYYDGCLYLLSMLHLSGKFSLFY